MSTTYILFKNGNPVHLTTESPWTGTPALSGFKNSEGKVVDYDDAKNFREFKSYDEAVKMAKWVTDFTNELHLACTDGHYFTIISAPKIGDEVSHGFNGDYHYVGKIIRITPNWMVVAEDADGHQTKFNRRKNTAQWKQVGGYGSMVRGSINRLNPEF